MAQIYPLFSSSSGNACFIGNSNAGILIDAGTNCRRILLALKRCGIPEDAIKAVFITHDHSDHIGALRVLTKTKHIPVYASSGTAAFLINSGNVSEGCHVFEIGENGAEESGFFVRAFHTPHDAVESVFYKIHTPDGKTACVCTDLGYIPKEVDRELLGSDMVLLEANYDEQMLRTGPYPFYLKNRVASELGHLSNADSAKEIKLLVENGTRRIILGHLSRNNNTPAIAERTVIAELKNMVRNRDYILNIAPVETDGRGMSF